MGNQFQVGDVVIGKISLADEVTTSYIGEITEISESELKIRDREGKEHISLKQPDGGWSAVGEIGFLEKFVSPVLIRGAEGKQGPTGRDADVEEVARTVAQKLKENTTFVNQLKGEKGEPGESIKGEAGEPGRSIVGDPGKSIIGPPGPSGESPTVKEITSYILSQEDLVERIKQELLDEGKIEEIVAKLARLILTEKRLAERLRGEKGESGKSIIYQSSSPGGGSLAFSGLSKITVGVAQPSSPSAGDLWVDTS